MTDNHKNKQPGKTPEQTVEKPGKTQAEQPKEVGGRKDGLDPTRYGDWERKGRCIDF